MIIKKILNIKKTDIIIEPSAGNGAFIEDLNKLSDKCLFMDIKPENSTSVKDIIIEYDYLKFNINSKKRDINNDTKIHIIGNPPFGRQSSLAIKFIKKSCEFCDTLSFILPKSFKKESLKKHFPLNFHLIHEIDLPKYSFNVSSGTDRLSELNERIKHDVPCIFQIWIKKDTERIIEDKLFPLNFDFVKITDNPDISFRRVGGTAGYVDKDYQNKSIQSHHFIKFNDQIKNKIKLEKIIEKLNNIKYDFNNTVGPKSLSKQEIIYNIEKLLN
jgi:hypothetical protein